MSGHLPGTADPEEHRDLLLPPACLLAPRVVNDLALAPGSLIGAIVSSRKARGGRVNRILSFTS